MPIYGYFISGRTIVACCSVRDVWFALAGNDGKRAQRLLAGAL